MMIFFLQFSQGSEPFDQPAAGKSRFSQWFRPDAGGDGQPGDSAQLSAMQKLRAMGAHNEIETDKMASHPAPSHPAIPSEMSNAQSSFLEMLQRGKLAPQNHATENNNIMNFQQAAMQQQGAMAGGAGGPGGPMSVEELEARLRGPNTSNPIPLKIEQNFEQNTMQQPNRSTTPQQQDMAAFKKLVSTA